MLKFTLYPPHKAIYKVTDLRSVDLLDAIFYFFVMDVDKEKRM